MGTPPQICRVTRGPLRKSRVLRVEPTDRLVGDDRRCATLRLSIEVEVVSDYLHIGRGAPEPIIPRVLVEAVKQGRSFDEKLRIVESIVARLGGVKLVKRMYAPRGVPAIPGSSLKGAVRSRIELGAFGDGGLVPAEMHYGNEQPLTMLPPPGQHGWRHARIWCESVFEPREYQPFSPLDDLMGRVAEGEAISSRVHFSDLTPLGEVETRILVLDHGEAVEAVPRGVRFRGEILLYNVSLEELGLLLYGLGLDKSILCGREPLLLMGASKYRDRVLQRECTVTPEGLRCRDAGNRRIRMGIVRVSVTGFSYAPWTRCRFGNGGLLRQALEAAKRAYPGLRLCFDEVDRRLNLS